MNRILHVLLAAALPLPLSVSVADRLTIAPSGAHIVAVESLTVHDDRVRFRLKSIWPVLLPCGGERFVLPTTQPSTALMAEMVVDAYTTGGLLRARLEDCAYGAAARLRWVEEGTGFGDSLPSCPGGACIAFE